MDASTRGRFLEDPPEGAPDIEEGHHVSQVKCTVPYSSENADLLLYL